jgi:sphinganine-1-phosphate aldolase
VRRERDSKRKGRGATATARPNTTQIRRRENLRSCVTAHAAIDKACEILGCRHVRVGYDPETYKLDVAALSAAITSDTIMLYSSAPSFPQGVVDPISTLSDIAVKHDIGLHVDCCLGGFVLPFAKKLGYDVPEFDFTLPGVTSMSCDTHKYGYASKGTSVVLYRHKDLRRAQYFCYPEWTGGLYVTPTIAGSRPGALSAACWASLMAMGEDGFSERIETIMDTTQEIAEAVEGMEGLYLLGKPKSMVRMEG